LHGQLHRERGEPDPQHDSGTRPPADRRHCLAHRRLRGGAHTHHPREHEQETQHRRGSGAGREVLAPTLDEVAQAAAVQTEADRAAPPGDTNRQAGTAELLRERHVVDDGAAYRLMTAGGAVLTTVTREARSVRARDPCRTARRRRPDAHERDHAEEGREALVLPSHPVVWHHREQPGAVSERVEQAGEQVGFWFRVGVEEHEHVPGSALRARPARPRLPRPAVGKGRSGNDVSAACGCDGTGVVLGIVVDHEHLVGGVRLDGERGEQAGKTAGLVPCRHHHGHPPGGGRARGGREPGHAPEQQPPDDPGDREERHLEQRSHASSSTPPAIRMSG
jgi:hypothetical protein